MTSDHTWFPAVVALLLIVLAAAGIGLAGTAGAQSESDTTFVVTINGTNSPVTENETLDVEVIIENTGDDTGSQEIYLNTSGTQRDVETVALDPGASISQNLTWDTESDAPGQYEINVSSEDDFSTRTVRVNEVSDFDVEIDSVNEPIREDDTLEVEAIVENTDRSTDTQEIELEVDGSVRDSETLSLNGGNSGLVTLEWETDTGDAGEYEANVTSETDTESTDVDVNAPPTAAFTYDPNVPNVNQAVTFDASSSADPDGETVRYTWAVDGENVSGSETFAYTFTESGDHEVRLYITDDDGVSATVTRTVTVNAPPTASIQPVDATVDEETTIEANVSDDGTIARYEWYVDGDLVSTEDTLSYTFDGSGTTQVRLEVTDENGATTATTRAVTVESDGASTDTDRTDSPDDMEPTDTDETTAQDGPGFGVVVALLAVVVAALTARRRSD